MKNIGRRLKVFICPFCNSAFEYNDGDIKHKYDGSYKNNALNCIHCSNISLEKTNSMNILEIRGGDIKSYIKL